jgi:hypothetical protein
MASSRVTTRLYPHIGGILIYSNVKMNRVSKDVLLVKKSLRRAFKTHSTYTQELTKQYVLQDNEQLIED